MDTGNMEWAIGYSYLAIEACSFYLVRLYSSDQIYTSSLFNREPKSAPQAEIYISARDWLPWFLALLIRGFWHQNKSQLLFPIDQGRQTPARSS